jgi:hypothetical protein
MRRVLLRVTSARDGEVSFNAVGLFAIMSADLITMKEGDEIIFEIAAHSIEDIQVEMKRA